MKDYTRLDDIKMLEHVGFDVVLSDAIMDLIESGIDEDCHFWGSTWCNEIDDDDLEAALADPKLLRKTLDRMTPDLIEQLKKVLEARREEDQRHPR